ncbi:hypothetical protein ACLQ26_27610 [Micromonospora sp. DT43]|uniref:hypothetical protein n=1 Tax=Micromonospora sp. DT43 TaxID=3393440 RepID=UPI003CEB13A5
MTTSAQVDKQRGVWRAAACRDPHSPAAPLIDLLTLAFDLTSSARATRWPAATGRVRTMM